MNNSNAMRNPTEDVSKSSKTVYADDSDYYLVDRHEGGTFCAENIRTGETRIVDALALECCRLATEDEVKLLGIKLD